MCVKETFMEQLQWEKRGVFYYISMIVQSAPLIKGIRASHLINIKKEEADCIRKTYDAYGMDSNILCEEGKKMILLLYRKDKLEKHLLKEECSNYLRTFGYTVKNLGELLEKLSSRMKEYAEEGKEFPHEIGVFLEYPIADIKAFIAYKGQNFLFCGYWKVYTNPMRARQIFDEYDSAKKEVIGFFQKIFFKECRYILL